MTETKEYPRWLYNKDAAMKRVENAREEKDAGNDWQCNPLGGPLPTPEPEPKPEPKAKAK